MTNFHIECVFSKVHGDYGLYSRFVMEPLEHGQGITVGNALRRVLLSNLVGTAITSVRIGGVSHEFATVPGVREDVLELLLNLRGAVFKSHLQGPQMGRLVASGPSIVTASMFELSPDVEIVNPGQYIATLTEGSRLEVEFQLETGTGYKPVERTKDEATSLDFLQVDAVFMPVTSVTYSIEDIRGEGTVAQDRLVLDIITNGSLKPEEALSQAASILVDTFSPLKDLTLIEERESHSEEIDPAGQIPIEELQLSVRAYNCLKRAQINSVSDLLDYSHEDLLEIKNFGQKSAEEVVEALKQRLGISLPQERLQ